MNTTPDKLLRIAGKLFAEKGFAGASMRQIAREANITQAAIYHHFDNKEELYFAAVKHLHHEKIAGLSDVLKVQASLEKKLQLLVETMLALMDEDPYFRHIYFRELMEGDENRLNNLARNVFAEMPDAIDLLMEELAPHLDSHLMMMSLTGLVFHHLEVRKITPFLPGGDIEKTRLPVIADHITTLLLNGVRQP